MRLFPKALSLILFAVCAGCGATKPSREDIVNSTREEPAEEANEDRTSRNGDQALEPLEPITRVYTQLPELTPSGYVLDELLAYEGPSSRTTGTIENPIKFGHYKDTPRSRVAIDRLLSSKSIPFKIGTMSAGRWKKEDNLGVVFSVEHYQVAASILVAAFEAGIVEEGKRAGW